MGKLLLIIFIELWLVLRDVYAVRNAYFLRYNRSLRRVR